MKTLIGGAVAAVLGLIGMAVWWKPFLQILSGAIPFTLLLGGGLALYLGFDELKDTWKKDDTPFDTPVPSDDSEKYKGEIEELKKELETLKEEKEVETLKEEKEVETPKEEKELETPEEEEKD